MIESEPIFEYPFEKHFEARIYAKKPEWSPVLKKGMLERLLCVRIIEDMKKIKNK